MGGDKRSLLSSTRLIEWATTTTTTQRVVVVFDVVLLVVPRYHIHTQHDSWHAVLYTNVYPLPTAGLPPTHFHSSQ